MKLRWIILLAAGVALVALFIYYVSRPYLYGETRQPPAIEEFRTGTFRDTTATEVIP